MEFSSYSAFKSNYIEGWKNHEIRKIREKSKKEFKNFIEEKNWAGNEKLKNKTIFVQSEQGLGDYIQYCRYLPMLEDLGAKIILNTPKSIDKIIRTLKINYTHVNDIKDLKFDYNCSLMSLPLVLKQILIIFLIKLLIFLHLKLKKIIGKKTWIKIC